MNLIDFIRSLFKPVGGEAGAQIISPLPESTPTPQPQSNILSAQAIEQGLRKFNPNTPLASQSGVLKQAMELLSKQGKIDPMLALIKPLMETRGGLDLLDPRRQLGGSHEGVNNPLNIRDVTRQGKFVNYPDFKTAFLGGYNPEYNQQSQGFVNMILNSPAYAKYRETGNLGDFNSVFTPQSDNNPSTIELARQFNELKKYFQQ